jgi:glycosyltransferase involved in cell wall biosynthesis
MKRVLIVNPSLQPPGGSNAVASWMVQALAPVHRVSVLTWSSVDVAPINRFFGTSLSEGDFESIVMPRAWTTLPDHLPVPAHLIKMALLMRYTRRISDRFDVLVGVFNETDFGRRGIQYVHYPTYLRPRPKADLRWYHPPQLGLDLYYGLADRIAGFSMDRLRTNLTLVNSDWTGRRAGASLGVSTTTVYPPVIDPAPPVPWERRQHAFLAVGRISEEKDYARVMRILARVREQVPGITLTIVGTSDRFTQRYFEELQALARSLGPWIVFRQDASRDEVRAMMATHRYGLHGMREEHFGMAPAEMARAGMIVWVPNGGGQVEVVGHEPALMYETDADAVTSVCTVIGSADEQSRLREHLAHTTSRFSVDTFITRIRTIVEAFQA